MKQFVFVICNICVLSLTIGFGFAQREKSALLPQSEAKTLSNQCSRQNPPEFSDTWLPTEADIKAMESRFHRIKELRAKCCGNTKINDPEYFYMQYVGIIAEGKKLIYINAFADENPPKNWKEQAIITCDGGVDWGVVYDSDKGEFFDLATNGIA